jgi:hypothetical protein
VHQFTPAKKPFGHFYFFLYLVRYIITFFFLCSNINLLASEVDSTAIYGKYITKSKKKASHFNNQLKRTDKKYLRKYFRAENKLHRKLCRTNPALADKLFSYSADPLFYHQKDALNPKILKSKSAPKEYFPTFDSLKTSVNYIDSKNQASGETNTTDAAAEINELDNNLSYSDKLQHYFRQRKLKLAKSLSDYPQK